MGPKLLDLNFQTVGPESFFSTFLDHLCERQTAERRPPSQRLGGGCGADKPREKPRRVWEELSDVFHVVEDNRNTGKIKINTQRKLITGKKMLTGHRHPTLSIMPRQIIGYPIAHALDCLDADPSKGTTSHTPLKNRYSHTQKHQKFFQTVGPESFFSTSCDHIRGCGLPTANVVEMGPNDLETEIATSLGGI